MNDHIRADDISPDEPKTPKPGIGLCLSGGGYRAMVFHLGTLIRLDEAGLLGRLARISSVSGGSITAAYLGLKWNALEFGADGRAARLDLVVEGIRRMASTSIDAGSIIGGILLPGRIADRVARAYAATLYGEATLQDLPDAAGGRAPVFVINATNVQSAALWRFTRAHMGDYRVGLVPHPTTTLAMAVTASSAFPPLLSPVELTVTQAWDPATPADLGTPEFRDRVLLSDGGVYDNLGLEQVLKRVTTVLVSDAGQKIEPEADPGEDWARHSIRVMSVTDNQVRSLRKRELIDAYERGDRTGAYWGIRTDWKNYGLQKKFGAQADPLGCAGRDPTRLADIPTRLKAMPTGDQDALVNWGYAVTDAALRSHFGAEVQKQYGVTIAAPKGFPCPGGY